MTVCASVSMRRRHRESRHRPGVHLDAWAKRLTNTMLLTGVAGILLYLSGVEDASLERAVRERNRLAPKMGNEKELGGNDDKGRPSSPQPVPVAVVTKDDAGRTAGQALDVMEGDSENDADVSKVGEAKRAVSTESISEIGKLQNQFRQEVARAGMDELRGFLRAGDANQSEDVVANGEYTKEKEKLQPERRPPENSESTVGNDKGEVPDTSSKDTDEVEDEGMAGTNQIKLTKSQEDDAGKEEAKGKSHITVEFNDTTVMDDVTHVGRIDEDDEGGDSMPAATVNENSDSRIEESSVSKENGTSSDNTVTKERVEELVADSTFAISNATVAAKEKAEEEAHAGEQGVVSLIAEKMSEADATVESAVDVLKKVVTGRNEAGEDGEEGGASRKRQVNATESTRDSRRDSREWNQDNSLNSSNGTKVFVKRLDATDKSIKIVP